MASTDKNLRPRGDDLKMDLIILSKRYFGPNNTFLNFKLNTNTAFLIIFNIILIYVCIYFESFEFNIYIFNLLFNFLCSSNLRPEISGATRLKAYDLFAIGTEA
ncbi:hypothetical protein BpHYR1_004266 [Brachionus plicatilis]|uniref:Uncharacterized protein n=1 Tax=Brachionus plicatilis TaxID=10195 RepID=A0A3M7QAI8_BRAPC|nr:hypothetical protein BpHYR1_004266 [Brachionus plicatilis]